MANETKPETQKKSRKSRRKDVYLICRVLENGDFRPIREGEPLEGGGERVYPANVGKADKYLRDVYASPEETVAIIAVKAYRKVAVKDIKSVHVEDVAF